MHRNSWRPGLSPRSHWGSSQCSRKAPSWWGEAVSPLSENSGALAQSFGLQVSALWASPRPRNVDFVPTLLPLSSPRQTPQLFQVFLTEALIFIKPPEVYRQACNVLLSEYCSITYLQFNFSMSTLFNTILGLFLFCDYRNGGSTPQ